MKARFLQGTLEWFKKWMAYARKIGITEHTKKTVVIIKINAKENYKPKS